MVSATADPYICQIYFNEKEVDFYECKKSKYQGVLNQYPQRTMSCTSISSNPNIIHKLMKHF